MPSHDAQPVARHTHANLNWDEPFRRFFWVLAMYCWTRAVILTVGTHARRTHNVASSNPYIDEPKFSQLSH